MPSTRRVAPRSCSASWALPLLGTLALACSSPAQPGGQAATTESASGVTTAAAPGRPHDGWSESELPPGFARRIVLVTIDTLRADVLGFMGKTGAGTPHLDRLAAQGVYFSRAHAHNVMTLPSHANLLTGRLPYEHGIRDNAGFRLDERWPTMATLLQDHGYETAAVIGAFPLDARYGLARGFDLYDDRVKEGAARSSYTMAERRGDEVVQRGLQWLQQQDGKSFLWLHLFDPHAPYAAEPRFREQHRSDAYQAEVTAVDSYLEPLFAVLEQSPEMAAETLLVLTSDHGEALGEHGETTHGLFAYEPTLRVPLVVWSGALPSTGHDAREARHIDVLPTVLDAAGIAAAQPLPGASLLRGASSEAWTYFEALGANLNRGWAPLRGVLLDDEKFISLPVPELYDLAADPDEEQSLVAERQDAVRTLRRLLPEESQWPPPERSELSDAERRQLQSLGYLSGSAATKMRYGPEDDPKNLVAVDQLAHRFVEAYQRRELAAAETMARELVQMQPRMAIGYYHLAQTLLDRGKHDEALDVMGTAYRRQLASPGLRRQLALTLTERGRTLEALQVLESLGEHPDPDTLNVRGMVLAESGRLEEAQRTLEKVFQVDPRNPEAHEHLARTHVLAERWREAQQSARRAIELNEELPLAWNYLGLALYNEGDAAAAVEAWEEAARLAPQDFDLLFNLAIVAAEIGDVERARQALQRFITQAPSQRYKNEIAAARQRLSRL